MSERGNLEALLARVLKGNGEDRELDGDIAVGVGGWGRKWVWGGPSDGWYWRKGDYSWTKDGDTPPRYTASLEAALTLVPETYDWHAQDNRKSVGACWAGVSRPLKGRSTQDIMRDKNCIIQADTPERAIIAACIYARLEGMP